MNNAKIKTILDWSTSKNFRDIQIFISFANFYRRFILRFSKIVRSFIDTLVGMVREKKLEAFY
jgi:hypothetical protein